ncbi:transposase family protein [Methylopila turkensis]|uniref:Integrase catalytic domain-containing protein n=1 Tax=Methylopila turkensis TaxID=1437816 RepID=A0A9W6N8V0_9HYPH|nr:transposase family protein [Methylopila turkensis]GLK81746.1 hypothetical protein GCM10008174_34870 [Methylopila turkensis]
MNELVTSTRIAQSQQVSLNLRLRKDGIVVIDGRNYIFIRLFEDGRLAFDDEENARRRNMTEKEFVELYMSGRISVRDWSVLPSKFREEAGTSLELLPQPKITKAKWRHAYCVAFDSRPVPKTERAMKPIIDDVATANNHEKKPDWRSVTRWLRERGVKGRRELRTMRSFDERKGRKKGVGEEAESIIQDAIKHVYMSRQMLPAGAVVAAVIGEINRRNELLGETTIEAPSPATVYRRIAEHSYYKTLRIRWGKRAADRELKPLQAAPEATRPLETIIIDHTKIDDWMFFEDGTELPCGGRPWLTLAIDAYSRYPLGYYIGFEPPSVYSVMMCLRQAISPKTAVFEKFSGLKADWRAAGLPLKLVADNAKEVVGLSLPQACAELGIELETSPVRTPHYKGIIERFFGTLNTTFLHRLPGTTYGSAKTLRDKEIDPTKNMSMSFDTFEYLFLKWLTQDYCKARNSNIRCTPENRWVTGTEKVHIELPENIQDLQVVLSRYANGTVTRAGLRYKNLIYRNAATVSAILDLPRKSSVRVTFRFDPTDISTIYVLDASGQYRPMEAEGDYAKGLSLWQHKIIQEEARRRERNPKALSELMSVRYELMTEVHESIRTGMAKSFHARLRGIGSQKSAPSSLPIIFVPQPGPAHEPVSSIRAVTTADEIEKAAPHAAEPIKAQKPERRSRRKRNDDRLEPFPTNAKDAPPSPPLSNEQDELQPFPTSSWSKADA